MIRMSIKIEQDFPVTHEQFIEGITDIIKITTETLEIFKGVYKNTQNPFAKIEMERYSESLVGLVRVLKSYTIRVENGIELNPIVVFSDNRVMFGYREKKSVEFTKRWYNIIRKQSNGEMTI